MDMWFARRHMCVVGHMNKQVFALTDYIHVT